ncbi:MAG: molybdopterin molybdenumtransferase MoeA [Desulfobacteraceae bacterium]|nr:molybdopterin molybdenumtransferase MoeA [Desulfobacteraceae bacterium]
MSQFLKVKTAGEVLSMLEGIGPLPAERVPLEFACGRTLAFDIEAAEPVPHFARSAMDGFAVRARDTFGASESLPRLLDVSGEVVMGEAPSVRVSAGRAVAIPTGGMLPEGADAVVMVEYTAQLDSETIEVTRPVAPWDNVLKVGDDIRLGERIFREGSVLRAQDIGVLAAQGRIDVQVFRVPRVAVISTGDEILPIDANPLPPGKTRDVNSFSLAAQIESAGAIVGTRMTVSDCLEDLVSACGNALETHDMVVVSGGSSVGMRDYTLRVLNALPESELLAHGVAVRPGKPTILGRSGSKIFWGLPGQPVSALIICQVFVVPSIRRLQGRAWAGMASAAAGTVPAVLNRQLPSVHGRTDYFPVVLSREGAGPLQATPVFGKSGAISVLSRADGYVIVPEHVEGIDASTEVPVYLFS